MPEAKSDAENLEKLVRKIISLDAIERKVIHLRICEGLSCENTSRATGLRARSVMKLLENALAKFRATARQG